MWHPVQVLSLFWPASPQSCVHQRAEQSAAWWPADVACVQTRTKLLLVQALDSDTQKAMMAWYHKKQQQEQVHRLKRMQYSISTKYELASWVLCQQDMLVCSCSMLQWPATDYDNGCRSWRLTTMTTATATGQAPRISNQPCMAWAVYPGTDARGHRPAFQAPWDKLASKDMQFAGLRTPGMKARK